MEKIREGIYFEGIEQYKPYFYPRLATLLDYVVKGSVVYDDPVRLKEHYTAYDERRAVSPRPSSWKKGGSCPPKPRSTPIGRSWPRAPAPEKVFLSTLDKRVPGHAARPGRPRARPLARALSRQDGPAWPAPPGSGGRSAFASVLSCPLRSGARGSSRPLRTKGSTPSTCNHLNGELKAGNIVVTTGALETGAEFPDSKLVVLTDLEVFGRTKRRRTDAQERGSGSPHRRLRRPQGGRLRRPHQPRDRQVPRRRDARDRQACTKITSSSSTRVRISSTFRPTRSISSSGTSGWSRSRPSSTSSGATNGPG